MTPLELAMKVIEKSRTIGFGVPTSVELDLAKEVVRQDASIKAYTRMNAEQMKIIEQRNYALEEAETLLRRSIEPALTVEIAQDSYNFYLKLTKKWLEKYGSKE